MPVDDMALSQLVNAVLGGEARFRAVPHVGRLLLA